MARKYFPFLETVDLTIKFKDFVANDAVSLQFYKGFIHSIVGENGAGKSTLMKMLYGVYHPTSGKIKVDNQVVEMTPTIAMEKGIGMVFQDFRLIPAFTALENIMMALPKSKLKLGRAEICKEIKEISEKYKIAIDPDMYVWEMDLGQRQRVEIIKVMMMGKPELLIFDEPTSVLTVHEAQAFLEMLVELKNNNIAVALITHKLNEVLAVSDTISVLRHGKVKCTIEKEEGFDKEKLVGLIMGVEEGEKNTVKSFDRLEIKEVHPMLECKDMRIKDEHGRSILKHASLTVNSGEIVGVAGISGRGQRELLESIFGLKDIAEGTIKIDSVDFTDKETIDRINSGMSFISEDPKRDNVVEGMEIRDHFVLAGVTPDSKGLDYDWKKLQQSLESEDYVKDLGVPQLNRQMSTLSGGNIQRAVLARAAIRRPKVLLASYPIRGLDIGTAQTVHRILIQLRNQGSAILLVSEDMDEIFEMSDSIVVLSNNSITEKFDPKKITPYEIGELMIGGAKDE